MNKSQESTQKKARQLKTSLHALDTPKKEKLKAIAIKYDAKKDRAPKIVAVGKGMVAEKILKIAEEHKIPFFEDSALTDLLGKLDIESDIPPELYTLIAEVLAFVYQLNKLSQKKKNRARTKQQFKTD
ncbi:MAG: hypothetical protein GY730_10445 [bacterium]|nr:hypothetical protein [bacterium]